jgi:hypothetical protein
MTYPSGDKEQAGIALFIDIENLIGHCSTLGLPILVNPICQKLKEIAPIRLRRSFGDIAKSMASVGRSDKIVELRKELSSNMVTIEDIPYIASRKNSADMFLACAALAIAYENKIFTHFAFVATDQDYIPLYNKLRELGKSIIVISIDAARTSNRVIDVADDLFYYENLTSISTSVITDEDLPQESALKDYYDVLVRACKSIATEGRELYGAAVHVRMKQLKSDFDFSRFSFSKFSDFLASAENEGIIKVIRHQTGDVEIELVNAPPASRKPASPQNPKKPQQTQTYREILENQLKIDFPSEEKRHFIVMSLLEVFEPNITFRELIRRVEHNIFDRHPNFKNDPTISNVTFKVMLSLFFARAFSISQNENDTERMNTKILSITNDSHHDIENLLDKHYASMLKKKLQAELDPIRLSMALFGDDIDIHVNRCREIIEEIRWL